MSKPNDFLSNGTLVTELKSPEQGESNFARDTLRVDSLTSSDLAVLRRILNSLAANGVSPDARRMVVKTGRRLVFLEMGEIDWIEAHGNYVKFHAGRECYTVRSGIGQIAGRLNPVEFVRIHRSAIVNIKKIKELEPCDNGEYIVALKDGKQLSCSRGYGARLQQVVKRGYSV